MCDDPMKRAERRCRQIGIVGLCAALIVTMAPSALGLGLRTPVLAVLLLTVLAWVLVLGGCMLHALYLWAHGAVMIRKVGFIVLSAVVCLTILAASAFLLLVTLFLPEQKIVEQDGTSYVMQAELEGWETVGFSYHERVFLLFYKRQPSWSDTDYTRWQES
ncbi:hypothetical protein [Butyricicoccus pullicaecorum]|uniref:hypothetical protein n=1 Tax=Butyricicoccus pullicaecorum TaxID=501571 RepID=UPI00352098BB